MRRIPESAAGALVPFSPLFTSAAWPRRSLLPSSWISAACLRFAPVLLYRLHLLAQHELRWRSSTLNLGRARDLARQPQHSIRCASTRAPRRGVWTDPRSRRNCLFLTGLEVGEPGNEIRQPPLATPCSARHRRVPVAPAAAVPAPGARALFSCMKRASIHCSTLRLGNEFDACDEKRMAIDILENAEALPALADQCGASRPESSRSGVCWRPYRPGTDRRARAGAPRAWLQQQADRPFAVDRSLRGRDRDFTPDRHRQDLREQYQIAHRYEDQRVVGQHEPCADRTRRRVAGETAGGYPSENLRARWS